MNTVVHTHSFSDFCITCGSITVIEGTPKELNALSALGLQIADEAADSGLPVFFNDAEGSADTADLRRAARNSGLPYSELLAGKHQDRVEALPRPVEKIHNSRKTFSYDGMRHVFLDFSPMIAALIDDLGDRERGTLSDGLLVCSSPELLEGEQGKESHVFYGSRKDPFEMLGNIAKAGFAVVLLMPHDSIDVKKRCFRGIPMEVFKMTPKKDHLKMACSFSRTRDPIAFDLAFDRETLTAGSCVLEGWD